LLLDTPWLPGIPVLLDGKKVESRDQKSIVHSANVIPVDAKMLHFNRHRFYVRGQRCRILVAVDALSLTNPVRSDNSGQIEGYQMPLSQRHFIHS
jgi:hypothetical protein